MAIGQDVLLRESVQYSEQLNQEYRTGRHLYKLAKRRIFIDHAFESFRFVEGLIVMMRKCGVDAFFDWQSGFFTDAVSGSPARDLKVRIAAAETFVFLATEQSVASEECLKALRFAAMINRRIYVVETTVGKQVFSLPDIKKYHILTIETSKGEIPQYLMRVQDPRHSQLWFVVKDGSQL